jgi:hypothetical protein
MTPEQRDEAARLYKCITDSTPTLTPKGEEVLTEMRAKWQEDRILRTQESLQAMITLYGGERVAKWVRDLTFLIERKELP